MSRFRRLLMSVAVSAMITDLVLVAFACVPETTPNSVASEGGIVAVGAATSGAEVTLAGGSTGKFVQPAFFGKFYRWLRNCVDCIRGQDSEKTCDRCFGFRSRRDSKK